MAPHSNAMGLAVPGITSAHSRNGFGSRVILPPTSGREETQPTHGQQQSVDLLAPIFKGQQPGARAALTGFASTRSASRQRTSSCKATPCPICGRTKDGDCRWGDDWIACHSGAAANNLKPGQTIEADGQTWYLSRTGGGHSGMAHVYRPHRPGQFQKGRGGSATSTKALAEVIACRQFHAALRPRVHAALRLPHWEYCNLAELRLVADSFNDAQQLIHHLKRARRVDPALVRLLPIALHWIKALVYQLSDLRHFQRQQLGMGEGWL